MPNWPEWMLLSAAYERLCAKDALRDESTVQAYLFNLCKRCPIKWRADFDPFEPATPTTSGLSEPAPYQDYDALYSFFWQRPELLSIGWERSDAVYNGPLIRFARERSEWRPTYDELWRVRIQANVIRIHTGLIVADMRARDLLPPAPIESAATPSATEPTAPGSPSLPPSASPPAKRAGALESEYGAKLREKPLEGMGKSEWARLMEEKYGWNIGTLLTWLGRPENDEVWRAQGGKATSPHMKGSRRRDR